MSLGIDISGQLRRPSDLEALVRAVLQALPQDEAEWIEWKSRLPLGSAEGWFSISKQILGMANREPGRASRFAGGLGYVIVGAEPSNLRGVEPVDVAQLDTWLQRYLGPNGPVWAPNYLTLDGETVLVLVIEAPRQGDPIHLLHKTFQPAKGQGADAGTVFVRRQAETDRASVSEMQMLQARLTAGSAERPLLDLELGWGGGGPPVLTPINPDPLLRRTWLDARRGQLLQALELSDRTSGTAFRSDSRPLEIAFKTDQAPSLKDVIGVFGEPEQRSPDAYRAEVEDYLRAAESALHPTVISAVVEVGMNQMAWSVTNPTDRNFPSVEVVICVAGKVSAYANSFSCELPAPPWPYGKFRPHPGLFGPGGSFAVNLPAQPPPAYDPTAVIIDNRGSVLLTFQPGDLRPRETVTLDTFTLITIEPPRSRLTATWSATSTGVDGVCEGSFVIAVQEPALSAFDALPIAEFEES